MNSNYIHLQHQSPLAQVTVLRMSNRSMVNYNYLVVDPISRKAVIVDPAWQIDKIDQALVKAGASLSGVLITHSHQDHIHLAKPLASKYKCPIWMSENEIAISNFSDKQLIPIDETPWSVGQLLIQPILTPGHTPGCICYLIGDNLFTGDVLFAEGCGLCSDTHAAYDMYTSLEKLKNRLAPHTQIFPGHSYGRSPGQQFSRLLRENMYLQFTTRETFAAFRLRSGQDRVKMFNFQ
jgi:hydroxyacylglutathione hydrolase